MSLITSILLLSIVSVNKYNVVSSLWCHTELDLGIKRPCSQQRLKFEIRKDMDRSDIVVKHVIVRRPPNVVAQPQVCATSDEHFY
jgi:hypothetical protein